MNDGKNQFFWKPFFDEVTHYISKKHTKPYGRLDSFFNHVYVYRFYFTPSFHSIILFCFISSLYVYEYNKFGAIIPFVFYAFLALICICIGFYFLYPYFVELYPDLVTFSYISFTDYDLTFLKEVSPVHLTVLSFGRSINKNHLHTLQSSTWIAYHARTSISWVLLLFRLLGDILILYLFLFLLAVERFNNAVEYTKMFPHLLIIIALLIMLTGFKRLKDIHSYVLDILPIELDKTSNYFYYDVIMNHDMTHYPRYEFINYYKKKMYKVDKYDTYFYLGQLAAPIFISILTLLMKSKNI